jgi:maltokinase
VQSADLVLRIEPGALDEWVSSRRWFGAKARDLVRVEVLEAVPLPAAGPALVIAVVEAVFLAGTHERYQLPLALRPVAEVDPAEVLAVVDGFAAVDAVNDPYAGSALGHLVVEGGAVDAHGGKAQVSFHQHANVVLPPVDEVRALGAEQSNSSIVYDETLILKCYRRLEPGENPELEMLRFLSDKGFEHIPELVGWYEYRGEVMDATLGVAQRFVRGGRDGWELALEQLAVAPGPLIGDLADLGRVLGELHTTLGSDDQDPDFAPEDKHGDMLDLAIATVDEEIREVFESFPEDDERFAPIEGRGAELRELLGTVHRLGNIGAAIRVHGDMHLGQGLLAADGRWKLLDFEGEPLRSLRERRRKRSPLRDVASLLASVSYAAAAAGLRGLAVPPDWEAAARAAVFGAYLEHVDRALLPAGDDAVAALLSLFELEKTVYELRYELNNRPDWVAIPVAGIARLLEAAPA